MKGKISTMAAAIAALLFFQHSAFASWSPIGLGLAVLLEEGHRPGAAAAFPQPDDSVYGLNFSIYTGWLDEMYGISIAGFFMETDEVAGLELSGFVNETKWADEGVLQVAGIMNIVEKEGNGTQVAGIGNRAEDFTGIQIAALCNVMSGWGVGVQIGAINSAENLKGVQIGALNIVEENFSGVQIGAINILRSSDVPTLPILRIAF